MGKFGETVVSDYCLCGSVDGSNEGWVLFVKNKLRLLSGGYNMSMTCYNLESNVYIYIP